MANTTAKALEYYRRSAADCLRLAAGMEDNHDKAQLIEMARAWHNLAEENLGVDLPNQVEAGEKQRVVQQQTP
jgi:hypothetical protein